MSGSLSRNVQLKDLLDTLRCGLSALVPVVERAGIPWTEGDAYDDWEAIASVLYEQIVLNTVRNTGDVASNLTFPKYDLVYPSYESMTFFEVFSQHSAEALGPFVGFEATGPYFYNVKYAISGSNLSYDTTSIPTANFADCGVRLRVPSFGKGDGLEEIRVGDKRG